MTIRCFRRPLLAGIFILALCLMAGCGGGGGGAQEKSSGDSPKKAEQKKDNATDVLGKWTVAECDGNIPYLDKRKSVEFLEGSRLLIDGTVYTYTFLDSSRMEVSAGPNSARSVWTLTKMDASLYE